MQTVGTHGPSTDRASNPNQSANPSLGEDNRRVEPMRTVTDRPTYCSAARSAASVTLGQAVAASFILGVPPITFHFVLAA
jgi:hypothetical protein